METLEKKETSSHIHHGRNVKRLRQMALLSQKQLGERAGLTQQAVCLYEQKEKIEEDIRQRLAKGLGVSVDLINEMEEDRPLAYYIENITFSGNTNSENDIIRNSTGQTTNIHESPTLTAMIDKLEKSYEASRQQYETSLNAYKEMIELLKKENQELKEKMQSDNK